MKTGAVSGSPFGWVEVSDSALTRLRRELEQKGQGVVDEMGVLAIHSAYADYFFPGTSVLQTRPRYLFFLCWNLLWLASQRSTTATIQRRKDEAELWVTARLVSSKERRASTRTAGREMEGIIGVDVFQEKPPRPPAQRLDFIYWTALRRWNFYKSRSLSNRSPLFHHWRAGGVVRVAEVADESRDDVIWQEPLAELHVPAPPDYWQSEESEDLDFELTSEEARWLQDRLLTLDDVAEGPRLLAKAAELCGNLPPASKADSPRPWDDPLIKSAAEATGQTDRLERARQASVLAHYVRAIYAALVENVVNTTDAPKRTVPLHHYRDTLRDLAGNSDMRSEAIRFRLTDLAMDAPRLPGLLRRCLEHVQDGLRRVDAGEDIEQTFMTEVTHRTFEAVERRRKGLRARLPRTEVGAARRAHFDEKTLNVYDLDYRWDHVRTILSDLHRGLARE